MPYVNKIELRGFKSFGATKISLPLSRGLTAVVGPNGSGKSNIIDALCFVFGGRSGKTMRTERFSDFIYARNKHPATAFAEVIVHIDNRDGGLAFESPNLVISRRVDRGGKCICKLNGKRADLKEIVDLLAPVMGTPDGYNFVMQGEVKKIVDKSPVELRQIIEGLAGVSEYEEKKEKANRELQEASEKLRVLGARLEEIWGSVEKFRRDVQAAQKQRDLKRELESVRGAMLYKEILKLERKRKDLNRLVNTLGAKSRKLQSKYKELSRKSEAYERGASEIQRLINRKRESKIIIQAGSLRDMLSTLAEMLKGVAKDRERVLEEMENARRNLGREGKALGLLAQMERFKHLQERFNGLGEELERAKSVEEAREIIRRIRELLTEITVAVDGLLTFFSKRGISRADAAGIREFTKLEGRLQAYGEQAEDISRRIAETRAKLKETSSEETRLRSIIASLELRRERLIGRARRARNAANRLHEQLATINTRFGSKRTERTAVGKEIENSKQELTKIKADFSTLLRLDDDVLSRRARLLESELEALGQVNQRAAHDLREAQSRYDAEKQKYDKLAADRQAILDFMREIDEKKKRVFMQAFTEVSQHFVNIFRELSGTGVGNLRLENEEEPLEGGLEIEVDFGEGLYRLKGLSGGQKTLTALAFLFALQLYRPTTFYVMDEIDESLDPQNRKRVAELLRKFSKNSQMVVVTLYDTIAAAADRVFGIKKEKENGISQVFSVDLSGLGD